MSRLTFCETHERELSLGEPCPVCMSEKTEMQIVYAADPVKFASPFGLCSKHGSFYRAGGCAGCAAETTSGTKPKNPKDAAANNKLPVHLVPDTVVVYAALAFTEGAAKYGAFNWRGAGVSMSVYISALERHLKKLKNGEWCDPVTKVPHLSSIIACAGIIADAHLVGKLTDDRPPVAPIAKLIDDSEETVAHIRSLFPDRVPHHWTINDEITGD
jgi:hypothetical protein